MMINIFFWAEEPGSRSLLEIVSRNSDVLQKPLSYKFGAGMSLEICIRFFVHASSLHGCIQGRFEHVYVAVAVLRDTNHEV